MTNEEIRDALKIMRQRAMGKGLLRMTDERRDKLLELITDTEVMMISGGGVDRSRSEIIAAIERELQVK